MTYSVETPNGKVIFKGCKTDALRFAVTHIESKGDAVQYSNSYKNDTLITVSGNVMDLDVVCGTQVNILV